MHDGRIIDEANGYNIIECNFCGFVHIHPLPSQEELNEAYREEYYTTEKPAFIERQIEDLEWWNSVYDDRYDFFEEHLPEDRRRVLDIGCGPGFFLKRGRERSWSVLGIEPSRQAASFAKSLGLDVKNCFFSETEFEANGGSFDVIHMSEVLEHVTDPTELCRRVYELLNVEGIACIVVPNDYNPFQKILRERLGFKPYWLAPPYHINYFHFDSLEMLLKKIGFKMLQRTAMFPMEFFLMMGENYIDNDALGRECHGKRKKLDILLKTPLLKGFKRDMYTLMAEHGVGREIVMYARKIE